MTRKLLVRFLLCAAMTAVSLASYGESQTLPPLTGTFGGTSTAKAGYSGTVSQTLSPDNGAISMLFDGLKVEKQSGAGRRGNAYYILNVPVKPVSVGTVTVDLRGTITVGAGSKCAIALSTDSGRKIYQSSQSKTVFLRSSVDIMPGDEEITISILVKCESRPGMAVYLAEVDSFDIEFSRSSGN